VCEHHKQGTYYCFLKGHLKALVLHPALAKAAANDTNGGGAAPPTAPSAAPTPVAKASGGAAAGAAAVLAAASGLVQPVAGAAADPEGVATASREDAGIGPVSSPAASGSAGPDTAPPGRSPGPSPRGGVADGGGGPAAGAGGGFGVLGVGSKCEVLDADEWWKSRVVAWEPGRLPVPAAPPPIHSCPLAPIYVTNQHPCNTSPT
jgi:hypothetical protein